MCERVLAISGLVEMPIAFMYVSVHQALAEKTVCHVEHTDPNRCK